MNESRIGWLAVVAAAAAVAVAVAVAFVGGRRGA